MEVDEEVEHLLYGGLQPYPGDNISFESFMSENRQTSQKGPTVLSLIKGVNSFNRQNGT